MLSTSFKHLLGLALGVAAAAPCLAQSLTAVSAEPGHAPANTQIGVRVQLSPGRNDAQCGLTVDFGDGEDKDYRVGDNGAADLDLTFQHKYAAKGVYVVVAQGKFLTRGLKSAGACNGKLKTAIVLVE